MNPLLLPPRLLFRALDDLHAIAVAAARLEEVEQRLDARLAAVLELGERVEQLGHLVDRRIGEVDERAGQIVAMGDRVDDRVGGILEMGERMERQVEAILAQGERIEAAAREVADRGAQLAEALPVMQKAVDMAVPLEGAVERLGRIVDRLPQVAPRRRAPASK